MEQKISPKYKYCVWKGVGLYNPSPEKFENYFKSINIRVIYDRIATRDNGSNDLFFYVHKDDALKFNTSQNIIII